MSVDRAALPSCAEYFGGLLNVGDVRRGRRYRCPLCDARHGLGIDPNVGAWTCHACSRGGGVLDFEVYMNGGDPSRRVDLHDAARRLGALIEGGESDGERRRRREQRERMAAGLGAAAEAARTISATGLAIWDSSGLLVDVALEYLPSRCCVTPPADGDLRFHRDLRRGGNAGPALVGLVTDALDAHRRMSLHMTWITPTGKALVERPRLLLAGCAKAGGVIRLWPDDAVTTGLAIAEGIETALSLAHAFTPVWACLDAGNLAAFPVLEGIEALTIAADNDDAGLRAADACARRWRAAGREVRMVKSERVGEDLNDVARQAA